MAQNGRMMMGNSTPGGRVRKHPAARTSVNPEDSRIERRVHFTRPILLSFPSRGQQCQKEDQQQDVERGRERGATRESGTNDRGPVVLIKTRLEFALACSKIRDYLKDDELDTDLSGTVEHVLQFCVGDLDGLTSALPADMLNFRPSGGVR
jgi:hypothetical protein